MIIDPMNPMTMLNGGGTVPGPQDFAPTGGLARLTQLGVIRAQGEDAVKFLHNQLTQDFQLLPSSETRLCALCSAKGRMLASFIGFKQAADQVLLVCSADLVAPMVKRLSMFVLRAKVKLSDASADYQLAGICGEALRKLRPEAARPWSREVLGDASLIGLYPASGLERALWISPVSTALPEAPSLTEALWQWTEVQSGVATLSAPLVEALVPQMLNYESVGGVSFKKGCYPGQEVVARSQFRGTLKRRAFLVHGDVAMQAGQEVFTPDDAEQPCGVVAQAAAAPNGGWDALVSVQIAAVERGLHLAQADGAVLTPLPLPYTLLEEV